MIWQPCFFPCLLFESNSSFRWKLTHRLPSIHPSVIKSDIFPCRPTLLWWPDWYVYLVYNYVQFKWSFWIVWTIIGTHKRAYFIAMYRPVFIVYKLSKKSSDLHSWSLHKWYYTILCIFYMWCSRGQILLWSDTKSRLVHLSLMLLCCLCRQAVLWSFSSPLERELYFVALVRILPLWMFFSLWCGLILVLVFDDYINLCLHPIAFPVFVASITLFFFFQREHRLLCFTVRLNPLT